MPGTNLTREEAAARADLLHVKSYRVAIDLTTSAESFTTSTIAEFSCRQPGAETFCDFIGEQVLSVRLNGVDLDPAAVWQDSRITLPDLAAENTLEVHAIGRYMHTGEGLHRFVDPVDNEVYLYTQFETADSRRMFPVFEQPDLKATFAFTVTAPTHWQIISVEPTPEPRALGSKEIPELGLLPVSRWEFPATPRLSSYVTALIAGPYDVVRDSVRTGDREVPLGLFYRRSLSTYLDADNVFDCTKRGFAFYEELFALPYPFTKYDQIFTPEYNAGAMENVGAVTYNEIYVFRAKVADAVVERRALTILHELAHMWFGNLVTMQWWDDLWLNESFAEWASMTCQAEATEWTHAWATFAAAGKSWALRQDQLSSTHPVAADIRHLADVEVNFDGITYAKGAAALKQLVAYVGRDSFVAGLRAYFTEFAYGNTTLSDLLGHMETTSGRDLSAWSHAWLKTAGPNTLHIELDTDDHELVTGAVVHQSAPENHPTLRPHRLAIGLYDLQEGRLVRRERLEIDIDGEETEVAPLVGLHRPDLLLLNDDDLTYAKIRFDEESLRTLIAHASTADPLPRALLLGAAWDMTRDGEMAGSDFIRLVLDALPGETDSTLLRMLLSQLTTTMQLYLSPSTREQTTADAAEKLIRIAREAPAGSDAQLQLVSVAAGQARTPEQLAWVDGLLAGTQELHGLAIDTEMRWTLLTASVAGGNAGEEEIRAEEERDPTSTGRERAARARAAQPTAQAKAEAWSRVFDSPDLSNQMVASVLAGISITHDETLLAPYITRYHNEIRALWEDRTHAIAELVALGAYPTLLAGDELLQATQAWLDHHSDAPDGLTRLVTENRDAVIRAMNAQERDAVRF
ncbi:aminopeptidase N [Austwickia chelonae]|uniref:Aminopeptidase N n=1 Tax=Austwickia chelonae NBRC 105200 TaxID=1184607 RepID=K6ULN1_9MICO|nr:aminopeptidase N [Austwickia chelonae]GAB77391.1 aminopeptidase N [Austwickia chelonae NBRC 105200]SEW09406.1 aminopeptidase N [Austwickia chelonae]